MKVGKLTTVGMSAGVIIPRAYLRELGWFKGDLLVQQIRGEELVIRNAQSHPVKPTHQRRAAGDGRANSGE